MSELSKKKHILVVEDEPAVLETICIGLKSRTEYEFEPEGVRSPMEYLRGECHRTRYDLAIIDLSLDRGVFPLTGFRVIADIAFEHPNTPIIVYSAYPQVENVVQAIRCGAIDFIPKEHNSVELAQKVVEFFDDQNQKLREKKELEAIVEEKGREWQARYAGKAVIVVGGKVVAEGSSRMEALVRYGDLLSEHKDEWPAYPHVLEVYEGEVQL